MIDYSDCLILLQDLKRTGKDVTPYVRDLISTKTVSLDTLKFINDSRQLDLSNFYRKIRKSYNNKKSKIYISIMREIDDPNEVIITLSSLLTQILLHAKTAEDKAMFLKHARCDELTKVLDIYFKTFDITSAIRLIQLIKADIKAIESIQ